MGVTVLKGLIMYNKQVTEVSRVDHPVKHVKN